MGLKSKAPPPQEEMTPEFVESLNQPDWEDLCSTTKMFLPLMDLFERLADLCFTKQLPFFIDSGTLLGAVRHRGIIPWDYDGDIGMLTADYRRLPQELTPATGLTTRPESDTEPDATISVVFVGPLVRPYPFIDVIRYDETGRNFQSEALQKRYPLNMWRSQQGEIGWNYDLLPEEQGPLMGLPMWCGLMRAHAGWPRRLDRHYDNWHARPQSVDRAAKALPFDPMEPAVRLVPEFPVLRDALRRTDGKRPFVIRGLVPAGMQEDSQRAAAQLGQQLSGFTATDFATVSEGAGTIQPFTQLQSNALELLLSGERYVWVVAEKDAQLKDLQGRSMTSILTDNEFALWGQVAIVHQQPGDVLFLPKGASYRVYTYEPSVLVCAPASRQP